MDRAFSAVGYRHWSEVRDNWFRSTSSVTSHVSRPDPGLEKLHPLQSSELQDRVPMADVLGLRENMLAEALYQYQKASHSLLAVARLSLSGMNSWASFNAYHSALLSAKAVMALLGVGFPKVRGEDMLIDVFPQPAKRQNNKQWKMTRPYDTFVSVRLGGQLQQRYVWQAMQRVCRMTIGAWEGLETPTELLNLKWDKITPPRNHFLYQAGYWTSFEDISDDVIDLEWPPVIGTQLDTDSEGFLFRLALSTHRLSQWLLDDMAKESNLLGQQLKLSRWPYSAEATAWPAHSAYRDSLSI